MRLQHIHMFAAVAVLLAACGGGGGGAAKSGNEPAVGEVFDGAMPAAGLPRPPGIDPATLSLNAVSGFVWMHAETSGSRSAAAPADVSVDLVELDARGLAIGVLVTARTAADGGFQIQVPAGRALPSARLQLRATLPDGRTERAWFDEGMALVSPASEALTAWVLGESGLPALPADGAAQPFVTAVLAAQSTMEGMTSLHMQPDDVARDKLALLQSDPRFAAVTAAWRAGDMQAAALGDLGQFVPMETGTHYDLAPYSPVPGEGPALDYVASGDGRAMLEQIVGVVSLTGAPELLHRVDASAWSLVGAKLQGVELPLPRVLPWASFPLRPRAPQRVQRTLQVSPDLDGDGVTEKIYTTAIAEVGLPVRVQAEVDFPARMDRVALPVRLTLNEEIHFSLLPNLPFTSRTRFERWMSPGVGPVRLVQSLQQYQGETPLLQHEDSAYIARGVVRGQWVPDAAVPSFTPWPAGVPEPAMTEVTPLPQADRLLYQAEDLGPPTGIPGISPDQTVSAWRGRWIHEWDAAAMRNVRSLYIPMEFPARPNSSEYSLTTRNTRDQAHVFAVACGSGELSGDPERPAVHHVRRFDRLAGVQTGRWEVTSSACPMVYPHPTDPTRFAVVVRAEADATSSDRYFIRLYGADQLLREQPTTAYFHDGFWGDGSVFRFGPYFWEQRSYRLAEDGAMSVDDALGAVIGFAMVGLSGWQPPALFYPELMALGHWGGDGPLTLYDLARGEKVADQVPATCPVVRRATFCLGIRQHWVLATGRRIGVGAPEVLSWLAHAPLNAISAGQQLHTDDPYTQRYVATQLTDGRQGVLTVRIERRLPER
jgi:hypothetical protein